jgi:hypothetical protein
LRPGSKPRPQFNYHVIVLLHVLAHSRHRDTEQCRDTPSLGKRSDAYGAGCPHQCPVACGGRAAKRLHQECHPEGEFADGLILRPPRLDGLGFVGCKACV